MAESEKKLAALARKEEIDVECNNVLQSMAENMMCWQTAVHHDVARAEDLVASLQASHPSSLTPADLITGNVAVVPCLEVMVFCLRCHSMLGIGRVLKLTTMGMQ